VGGRLANRVVYGRRASPYQVLSDFARRIGGTYASEDVLPQMARIVAAGTGAGHVAVWLRVGDELHPEANSGDGLDMGPLPVNGQVMPPVPGADMSVPVMHQDMLLGAISLRMPTDESLRPAGQQLVADVAAQASLVLANAGLIEDLRTSRQRLVTAQDETRRRLERNIHDGAQQDLVALAIKLQLAKVAIAESPGQAEQVFGELQAGAAGALENLRDLARGIYPPLLADLGLAAALGAQASKSAVPVTIEADGVGRFDQDTEAAVYFCCLEALQNTAKYAHATQARICLQAQNGTLRASPCPTTGPATMPATPRWDLACGIWPTGSPRSAAGSRSSPLRARAPPSPGTSPSRHQRPSAHSSHRCQLQPRRRQKVAWAGNPIVNPPRTPPGCTGPMCSQSIRKALPYWPRVRVRKNTGEAWLKDCSVHC
jgi:histidine kinase